MTSKFFSLFLLSPQFTSAKVQAVAAEALKELRVAVTVTRPEGGSSGDGKMEGGPLAADCALYCDAQPQTAFLAGHFADCVRPDGFIRVRVFFN